MFITCYSQIACSDKPLSVTTDRRNLIQHVDSGGLPISPDLVACSRLRDSGSGKKLMRSGSVKKLREN